MTTLEGAVHAIAEGLLPLAHPLDALRNMPGNPRRGDVDAVARSYARFGQRKPIVARHDGTVIAGNHQLLAARQLGWTHLAVVFTDDDDATAAAFSLADNRTAELGGYDDAELIALLEQVSVDEELMAATAWSERDLKRLKGEVNRAPRERTPDQFLVVIDAGTEEDQLALIERFTAEGLAVRAVLS